MNYLELLHMIFLCLFQKPKDPTKVKKVKKEKKNLSTPDKERKPSCKKIRLGR